MSSPPRPPEPARDKPRTRRDKIAAWSVAIALTLVGLAVTVLELRNLLWPQADRPGSNIFWLAVGLITLGLGALELILGPGRQRQR